MSAGAAADYRDAIIFCWIMAFVLLGIILGGLWVVYEYLPTESVVV